MLSQKKRIRVLITGGAGYIGSILTPFLLEHGFLVTVLDNLMWQENSLASSCINPNFNIIRGDCRDEDIIKTLTKSHDIFIPLAALVGAPLCNMNKCDAVTINRDAIKLLCKHLSDEQPLVIPITNSGYGIGEKGKFCTEKTPLRPISLYGKTKVEAEEIAMSRQNSVSLRLATVFGMSPRMRIDLLVNNFVYKAVTEKIIAVFEGHFKRNYIHIRDVARAFLHVINNWNKMKGEVFNVGLSDANLSKLELCEKIKQHVPELSYFESSFGEDPDKRDYIVSNEKIEKTGFNPSFCLDEGIQELIKGYRTLKNNRYSNV